MNNKTEKKKLSFIKFLIDISGTPKKNNFGKYEKVIIACVSIDQYNFDDVIRRFKDKFPDYWHKKGHQLSSNKLEEIVAFFNEENIRMITIHFNRSDWNKYKEKYSGETKFEEKIMSILYFYVLKKVAFKNYKYLALIDNDASFDIKQTIVMCQRIAREREYNFEISFGYIDINPELRFPDWIASARRKIPLKKLQKYEHFLILKNNLPSYRLNRVF